MSSYCSSPRLPDRPWSWLVCMVGTLVFTIFIGLAWSYSVFMAVFMDRFDNSIEELSAIGSVLQCLIFLCVPITYKIVLLINFRRSAMTGVVICASSVLVSSFIEKNASFLFITYSIPYGLGCSLIYASCICATTKYFKKRQNLAIGILTTGYAMGLLILVPLLQVLLDSFGLKRTLWIMSGTLGCFFLMVYLIFDTNIKDDTVIEKNQEEQEQDPRNSSMKCLEIFKRPAYVISAIVMHVQCGSGSVVAVYLVKYCIESGLTAQQGANQFIVIGVMALVCSILAGRIMDHKSVNPFHVNQVSALLMAVPLFLIQLASKYYHFVIFSFFYGVGLGLFRPTTPVLFLNTVEPPLSKYSWPAGEFFASMGNGIFPPFIGLVIDETRSYTKGFVVTAGFVTLSFLLPFLQYCFKPWRTVNSKEKSRKELVGQFEEGTAEEIGDKEPLENEPEDFGDGEDIVEESLNQQESSVSDDKQNGDNIEEENLLSRNLIAQID